MKFRITFEATEFESEAFAIGWAQEVAEIHRLALVELQRERVDTWWTKVPLEPDEAKLEVAS